MKEKHGVAKVVCKDCGETVLKINNHYKHLGHFCHLEDIVSPEKYAASVPKPDFLQCNCKNVLGILAEDRQNRPAYYLITGRYKLETN